MAKTQLLKKEVLPFRSRSEASFYGAPIVGNPDPILRFLALKGEEAYRIMERNSTATFAARQIRDNNVLNPGSTIHLGRSKSRASKLLRDFAIEMMQGVYNWSLVEKKIQDALYWGWRPMEIVWRPDFRFKRKSYWVPKFIVDKNPENFRFTVDRDLAYVNPLTGDIDIFDQPLDELKWLICTYGSLDNPYGNGIYQNVWLINFARDRFFEMFAQGMQRSMGMIKVKEGGMRPSTDISGPEDSGKIIASVSNEIRDMVSVLNSHNILVERFGWTAEMISNINFADGWIKAIEYIDKQITRVVATESLSWQESEFGSRAQSVVHSQSGTKTAMEDAKQRDEWINHGIIERALEFNFGEIDPGDMPRFMSNVRTPLEMANVKTAYDMGGDIDGDELERRFNIPFANEETKNVLKGSARLKSGPGKQSVDGDPDKAVREEDEKSREDK